MDSSDSNEWHTDSRGWQERLDEYCRDKRIGAPAYNIVSDRRGGRTAWSATVACGSTGQTFQARFWYDGKFVNNAKADAAEVALRHFTQAASTSNWGGQSPSSPMNMAGGNDFNMRAGMAPGASNAPGMLAGFANNPSGGRPDGMGVGWSRGPAAQSGVSKPSW